MSRLDDLLKEAKNHFTEVYNTLDKGSTGRNIRHDKNALISTINRAFPATANDPQYASMDDLLAFGGVGTGTLKFPETPYSKAHATAQRNAMLPVEQGGLGLPENNTAMDRARAMGFDVDNPVYHGTRSSFDSFEPSKPRSALGNPKGIYFDTDKRVAEEYSQDVDGGYDEKSRIINALVNKSGSEIKPRIENGYKESEIIVKDPKNIRSRFAAFDPLKKIAQTYWQAYWLARP